MALEKLGAVFNQASTALTYTPRKFVISPETNSLAIIETDHNAYTEETTQQRKQQMAEEMVIMTCLLSTSSKNTQITFDIRIIPSVWERA